MIDEQSNLSPEMASDLPYITQQTNRSSSTKLQASYAHPGPRLLLSQWGCLGILRVTSHGFTSQGSRPGLLSAKKMQEPGD